MREGGEGNRTNEENANLFDKNVFRPRKTGASELRDFTSNTNNRELATSNPTESRSLFLAAQKILLGIEIGILIILTQISHNNTTAASNSGGLTRQLNTFPRKFSLTIGMFCESKKLEVRYSLAIRIVRSRTASFLSPFSRNTAQDEFKVKYGK